MDHLGIENCLACYKAHEVTKVLIGDVEHWSYAY